MTSSSQTGSYVDPRLAEVTVAERAATWFATKVDLKPTTRRTHDISVRVHIVPRWADVSLRDVTHAGVAEWVAGLVASGLAASTVRTPNGPGFRPRDLPGGDVAAFVAGRFRGTDGSTSTWPCEGEVTVSLPVAELVPYVEDGVVELVSPHRSRLLLGAWSWPALAARIGQLDADVEVVGPDELRLAFGVLAERFGRAARPAPGG